WKKWLTTCTVWRSASTADPAERMQSRQRFDAPGLHPGCAWTGRSGKLRGMPRPTCSRCQRPLSHCLCSLIPDLDSRTRVLILQHPSEASHALNTARLAALGLRNAELRVGEVFDELPQ